MVVYEIFGKKSMVYEIFGKKMMVFEIFAVQSIVENQAESAQSIYLTHFVNNSFSFTFRIY
jgi:hypothetical protein